MVESNVGRRIRSWPKMSLISVFDTIKPPLRQNRQTELYCQHVLGPEEKRYLPGSTFTTTNPKTILVY